MKRGFYTIMSAQFFSSLADNALFVGAVQLLRNNCTAPTNSALSARELKNCADMMV